MEEDLYKLIRQIADVVESMHKPEYATFFINQNSALYEGEEQIDGYELAEAIKKTVDALYNPK